MKKMMIALAGFIFLQACNSNPGESGSVDDGIKPIDENGALSDADSVDNFNPSVDTALGDHRVDTEVRDTSTYKLNSRQ